MASAQVKFCGTAIWDNSSPDTGIGTCVCTGMGESGTWLVRELVRGGRIAFMSGISKSPIALSLEYFMNNTQLSTLQGKWVSLSSSCGTLQIPGVTSSNTTAYISVARCIMQRPKYTRFEYGQIPGTTTAYGHRFVVDYEFVPLG